MGDQGNESSPRDEIAPITQITEATIRDWLGQYSINNQLIYKKGPLAVSTGEADDAVRKARYQGEQRVLSNVLTALGQRDAIRTIDLEVPSVVGQTQ